MTRPGRPVRPAVSEHTERWRCVCLDSCALTLEWKWYVELPTSFRQQLSIFWFIITLYPPPSSSSLPGRPLAQTCPDGERDLRNYVLIQLHICKSQPELLSGRNITGKTHHYQTYNSNLFFFRQSDHPGHLNSPTVQLSSPAGVLFWKLPSWPSLLYCCTSYYSSWRG